MASAVVKMECNRGEKTIPELADILKQEIDAEIVYESLRNVGNEEVLLLAFERYYFRNGSYASLTVMIIGNAYHQTADIIGFGGGEGLFNISWGANQSFADMAAEILREYGYMEIQ